MPDYAVECRNVWKKFTKGQRNDSLRDALPALCKWIMRRCRDDQLDDRQFWALQDMSFNLERGQALGIIGPNGAGKSTLLKLLSSIMVPNQGDISINGRLTALIEVGAGFHPDLTGRENIYLNGAILGMSRREISRKIGEIIDFAGVEQFIDTPVKRYSSGMQARLGFSVASHMDPEILLVDEVLAVGDAQFQERCIDRMHYFANSGRSIIFISHNLQAVSELCPDSILLMSGQKQFAGSTTQAIQQYLTTMREAEVQPMHGPTSIHRVQLLDTQGQPTTSFKAGERARVTFDLALEQAPSKYFFGFALKRVTDGLIVSDYNLSIPLAEDVRGPVPMSIDFDANFLSGSYCVTLFLVHRASYNKVVYLDFVKLFDVVESSSYGGVTHANPNLTSVSDSAPVAT